MNQKTISQRFDFEQDLIDQIDDYRYANRIPTRKKSVKELIERGIRSFQEEQRLKELKGQGDLFV